MNKQSLERLKEILEYNPETGKVTIKKSQRVLTADQDGIVVIFDSKAKPKTRNRQSMSNRSVKVNIKDSLIRLYLMLQTEKISHTIH